MSQLRWTTQPGTIASMYVGVPTSTSLIAFNTSTPTAPITYQVISGELPSGITLSTAGELSGTPTTTSFANTINYSCVIRARDESLNVIDGTFTIILNNQVNNGFEWVTVAGNLGTIPNNIFYSLPLEIIEITAGVTVSFTLVSGELPPGMRIISSGVIQGVPTLTTATAVGSAQTFSFTVRATNSLGQISDRGFSISVTNVTAPIIEPDSPVSNGFVANSYVSTVNLGSFFDGSYYNKKLYLLSANPNVSVTWSNVGTLPPGLTLSSDGTLSGYILPLELIGTDGPQGYDGASTVGNVVVQEQEYDYGPYDFNNITISYTSNFIIQAYDGVNYDTQNYAINIVSRSGFTADNGLVFSDNGILTVDESNVYYPILLNGNTTVLPAGRQDTYYAYKFEGYDFQGDTVTYSLSNTYGTFDAYVYGVDAGFDYNGDNEFHLTGVGYDASTSGGQSYTNLPGLLLDEQSGWLYGKLNPQTEAISNYEFGVVVHKTHGNVDYSSRPIYFTLPVLGSINNGIEWVTSPDLGTITNGVISELYVQAISPDNAELTYSLVDEADVSIRLPQGLTLLPSGELSGRVSFEAFTLDDYTTIIDGGALTVDRTYKFTVRATSTVSMLTATREFTVTLAINDRNPYNNLYLRALLPLHERQTWNNIISNTKIFNPDYMYRATDPWFGVHNQIEMLFLPGLNATDLTAISDAMVKNHYTKSYNFGSVKTAVVLDDLYNVKYEVVYIELEDPELTVSNEGPPLEINLNGVITNPYIDQNGNKYKVVYPNTSNNMVTRLTSGIDYYDRSTLPDWMTSNQLSTSTGLFNVPLGFTRAVVLAYTKPGYSDLIAYRLNNAGINFNNIEFTVDRYFVDNYYSTNFNPATNTFNTFRETTFDVLPNNNIGDIVATVTYALSVPYDQINGRPVSYINGAGGIDGITNFSIGDTLIFAQQENFSIAEPYDGWVNYSDGFIGDNLSTSAIEGYDSEQYDLYDIVPGYLEKVQGATVNKRGGVWKVNIVNDIVILEFVREVQTNQRIQVLSGKTYNGALLYYSQNLEAGQSVPYYKPFTYLLTSMQQRTTFNNNSTRFFNYRDQYYTPGLYDQMVKFPQTGIFN